MSEAIKSQIKQHSLILDNRESLTLTGIVEVIGFDDLTINVTTTHGGLVIKGNNLHINKLNLDSGEVSVDGIVNSLQYISAPEKGKGVFSKLFK